VDSPWVHIVNTGQYLQTVRSIQHLDPDVILSTHLPPAIGLTTQLLDTLAQAPGADPFTGPDQQALEQMLAAFQTAAPA